MRSDDSKAERRKQIVRAAQARYRLRHREELNQRTRERRLRDPAKRRAQQQKSNKKYRERHSDELKEANRRYRAKHRDLLTARMKEWRLKNLEAQRERDRRRSREDPKHASYMERWRKDNPDRIRAYLRASRHKRRSQAAGQSFTAAEWLTLLAAAGGRCSYCGADGPLTADHRVPLSRGGDNSISNILPACRRCNSRKHTLTEDEFRLSLAYERFFEVVLGPACGTRLKSEPTHFGQTSTS